MRNLPRNNTISSPIPPFIFSVSTKVLGGKCLRNIDLRPREDLMHGYRPFTEAVGVAKRQFTEAARVVYQSRNNSILSIMKYCAYLCTSPSDSAPA